MIFIIFLFFGVTESRALICRDALITLAQLTHGRPQMHDGGCNDLGSNTKHTLNVFQYVVSNRLVQGITFHLSEICAHTLILVYGF